VYNIQLKQHTFIVIHNILCVNNLTTVSEATMVTTVWVIPRKTNYCLSGHHGDCCVFNSKKIRIIILIPRCPN